MRYFAVIVLIFGCAAAFAEGDAELERLRRENAELKKQLLVERTRARDQAIFLAAVADEGEFNTSKEREARLLTKLAQLCRDGERLVVKSKELADAMRVLLREIRLDDAVRARCKFLIDDLERVAGSFASSLDDPAADPAEAFRSCRVLEVNRELKLVLLDLGHRQGAFVGLLLRGGPDKKLLLRLEDVRAGVAAATVLEGDLSQIVPGMEFSAEKRGKR